AGTVGQAHVREAQGVVGGIELAHGLGDVGDAVDIQAHPHQGEFEQLAQVGLVVDDEHPGDGLVAMPGDSTCFDRLHALASLPAGLGSITKPPPYRPLPPRSYRIPAPLAPQSSRAPYGPRPVARPSVVDEGPNG